MAPAPTQTSISTAALKKRAACDECRAKKLKCAGEQPICSRCARENIHCVYSHQKQMGRPKKRRRTENDIDQTNAFPQATWDANDRINPLRWDEAFPSSLDMEPWLGTNSNGNESWDFSIPSEHALPALTPDSTRSNSSPPTLNLPPELMNTSRTHSHAHPHAHHPQSDISTQMLLDPSITAGLSVGMANCACISSLYLILQNLQTMDPAFPFPSSLHPLREGIFTAVDCLNCNECPTRFISAVQNTQMIGTLIVSIADRFSKILNSITKEAERAEEAGEKKSLPLSSLNTSTTHLHPGNLGSCLTAFSISLAPSEWRTLAKKVVRAEVYGPNENASTVSGDCNNTHNCCVSFWEVTHLMQTRHKRWSEADVTADVPRDPATGLMIGGPNMPEEDHLCVKLARYSRKLVEAYDWS